MIEYEGDYHREPDAFRFDIARLNDLAEDGWRIIRVTSDDVFKTPEALVASTRGAPAIRTG